MVSVDALALGNERRNGEKSRKRRVRDCDGIEGPSNVSPEIAIASNVSRTLKPSNTKNFH